MAKGTVTSGTGLGERARAATTAVIRAGAILYRRETHLPRLLHLFPSEIPAQEPEATDYVLARLCNAARQERRRARAGHWAYDLNRHIALKQAVAAERRRRQALSGRASQARGRPA